VDTSSSFDNCGACGLVCAAGESCIAGACQVVCGAPSIECNGACVDIQNDPAHCSACGNACAAPAHATAVCVAGGCGFVCTPGFADCDQLAFNGCEAELAIDGLNCGACGVACAPCNAGQCGDPLAPPEPCEIGTYGVLTGDPWVVCEADAATAWIAANDQGEYEITKICQSLGYLFATQWGGNCAKPCGACEDTGFTQCWMPGSRTFEGSPSCNPPALYCGTVHWECGNSL